MDGQNFEEIQPTKKFNKEKFKSIFYKIFMSVLTFCYLIVLIIIVCVSPSPTYSECFASFFLCLILFLICSFLISYKEYNYKDRVISIYAGWYHHTLRIDGELCDEHNTLVSHTAITLSTTLDGEIIEARITLSNRISVKVNNKLLKRQAS